MAHIVQLPVLLNYRPRRARYKAASATVLDWAEKTQENSCRLEHFPEKAEREAFVAQLPENGRTALLMDFFLPHKLAEAHKANEKAYLDGHHRDVVYVPLDLAQFSEEQRQILVLLSHSSKGPKQRPVNPWTMRDEFLRLKQDDASLIAFLNKWGDWGPMAGAWFDVPADSGINYVIPSSVWAFQAIFRKALSSPPESWLQSTYSWVFPWPRREYPYHSLEATDCHHAITATITFDLLRDLPRGICARPDCSTPFVKESKHAKEYCCKYCAHLESVRRNRKLKSRSQTKSAKGKV